MGAGDERGIVEVGEGEERVGVEKGVDMKSILKCGEQD